MKKGLFCLLLALMLFAPAALAEDDPDDNAVFTVTDENGNALFAISHAVNVGDEYISRDNVLYRIGSIEKRFGIDLGQFGTRERLISCYRYKILTSNKFRQLLV